MVVDYLNVLADKGIEATINKPTRVELLGDKIVSSCIDHVNVRFEHNVLVSFIIEQKMSDHIFVGLRVFLDAKNAVADAQKHQFVVITDQRQVDSAAANFHLNDFLASAPRGDLYDCFVAK